MTTLACKNNFCSWNMPSGTCDMDNKKQRLDELNVQVTADLRARKRTSLSTERFQRDFSKTTCFGSIIPPKYSTVVLSSSRVVADGRIMQNRLFSWIIITLVSFSTWSVLNISPVFVHSPWESLIELSRVTDELFFLLRAHFRISITLLVKPKKKALRSVLWKTNGLEWKLLKLGL